MTDEPTNLEETQQQVEKAAEAPVFHFQGEALNPFSFARQACYERLYPNGAESIFECATAIVFLCTLGNKIVENKQSGKDIINAARGEAIEAFRSRLEAWADKLNLTANNKLGREVNRIGNEIWGQSKVGQFVQVKNKGKKESPNG